jgi:hypothetical protein
MTAPAPARGSWAHLLTSWHWIPDTLFDKGRPHGPLDLRESGLSSDTT